MEESMETFGTNANPKEPLKTEEIPQSSPDNEASGRSDGAASPPPNCSICLGKLLNTSFTDSCLHQFCFSCILQWSKIKTECPLCKQTFKSIIHNVRSEEDYDQYHVPRQFVPPIPGQQMAATLDVNLDLVGVNLDVGGRRFSYRTTMTPHRRYGVLLNPDQVARREQVPVVTSLVPRDERRRRRINPVDYRRNVYRYGTPATSLPDIFGRFRECSAEYYRREPAQLDRLIPFINRELQVLLNDNEPHIAFVMQIIIESLSRYDMRSPEFRDLVRPYFGIHTDHFIHELLNYARTSFDLIGYDQYVTYTPNQGLLNEYDSRVVSDTSSSSNSSNDSDVQVVDQTIDVDRLNTQMPGVGPHTVEMPGPSTVGEAFQEQGSSTRLVLTISSSSSGPSDNECEVVGYVKPRHERTPEIIDLSSTEIDEPNNPTICNIEPREQLKPEYPPVARQFAIFEEHFDQPSSGEIYEPSTSTNRKRSLVKRRARLTIESASSDTTSSDSDTDSDREYVIRRIGKLKNKSHQKCSPLYRKNKPKTSTRKRRYAKTIDPSSSDSESDNKRIHKPSVSPPHVARRFSSSSSDSSPDRHIRRSKTKEQSGSTHVESASIIKVRQDLIKKETRYDYDYATSDDSQTSSSVSDHKSYKDKKNKSKRHHSSKVSDSHKELRNNDGNNENHDSVDINARTNKKSNGKYEFSSTDSEVTSSKVRSSKTHARKKKSKHKDKRKDKRNYRSSSKSVPALDSFQTNNDAAPVAGSSASPLSSVISESTLSSKYSSSKKRSSAKEKRKSHKKRKESKKSHKRSKSESKSRSRRKKRRIKSSSSSSSWNSVTE